MKRKYFFRRKPMIIIRKKIQWLENTNCSKVWWIRIFRNGGVRSVYPAIRVSILSLDHGLPKFQCAWINMWTRSLKYYKHLQNPNCACIWIKLSITQEIWNLTKVSPLNVGKPRTPAPILSVCCSPPLFISTHIALESLLYLFTFGSQTFNTPRTPYTSPWYMSPADCKN